MMTSTPEPSYIPTLADIAREREVVRYYQFPELNVSPSLRSSRHGLSTNPPSSPDKALTAYAQLCALRLNASRAMISILSRDTQYFIAEATKTVNLQDTSKYEAEEDALWMGCANVPKSGRLCEKTIEAPMVEGEYSCFTVNDLSKSDAFANLAFVKGPPYFRYYTGTPLRTKSNVNIGSLFILDTEVRPTLSDDQQRFLGLMAAEIMQHLDTVREAKNLKKATRMYEGLNAFVEGRSHVKPGEDAIIDVSSAHDTINQKPDDLDAISTYSRTLKHPSSEIQKDQHPAARQEQLHCSQIPNDRDGSPLQPARHEQNQVEAAIKDSESDPDTEAVYETLKGANQATFQRAANMLRDSLDLQNRGGVCFLDTSLSFQGDTILKTKRSDTTSTESDSDAKDASWTTLSTTSEIRQPARVISASASSNVVTMPAGNVRFDCPFDPLDELSLQNLLERYPKGKVWIFDGLEGLSSGDESDQSLGWHPKLPKQQKRMGRKQQEISLLRKHFPNVRQLLFAPLWDAGASRWFSGCFCWGTTGRELFTIEAELHFVKAFGNSVMAEVNRLSSIYESRQKGDFIGSISHELRSPLHGILASSEFLSDTVLDAFQDNLVDTVAACGRTLLDTINHILDFSKINSFERSWQKARKTRAGNRGSAIQSATKGVTNKDAPPILNIIATTDVAAITEEVVEGIYAGRVYQDVTTGEIPNGSTNTKGVGVGQGSLSTDQQREKNIEVILDIAQGNFTFTTQPGAFRRIVMNIFGNALKYTTSGKIVIRLRVENAESGRKSVTSNVEIRITDTGKGISNEYLRTSLYTPFSQEDTLASGTGLGLSIVRSLVTLLGGTIHIQSEVGRGTSVTVQLPMEQASHLITPASTPTSVGSPDSLVDNSINTLRTEYTGKSVALYGFSNEPVDLPGTETGQIAKYYIEHWYKLKVYEHLPNDVSVDIVIVKEENLRNLLKETSPSSGIIVLCSKTRVKTPDQLLSLGTVEFMSTPFGPHKLAKALRLSLEKAQKVNEGQALAGAPMSDPSDPGSLTPVLSSFTLTSEDGHTPILVQTNEDGTVTASHTENARRAMGSDSSSAHTEIRGDFPFPTQLSGRSSPQSSTGAMGELLRQGLGRPKLTSRKTEPTFRPPFPLASAFTALGVTATKDAIGSYVSTGLSGSSPEPDFLQTDQQKMSNQQQPSVEKRQPRVLLVEDNKINLRLLETYMRKRKYELIDSALNGQLAVEAVKNHPEGYDVIFMDISMPVMNGFDATREIRKLEQNRSKAERLERSDAAAMIIALTGLASERDSGEAFSCGVDVYMTKPVQFKEVGRLLDKWEARDNASVPS